MRIFVRFLHPYFVKEVEVEPGYTKFLEVKQSVASEAESKLGISIDECALYYSTFFLREDKTCVDYNIGKETTLYLMKQQFQEERANTLLTHLFSINIPLTITHECNLPNKSAPSEQQKSTRNYLEAPRAWNMRPITLTVDKAKFEKSCTTLEATKIVNSKVLLYTIDPLQPASRPLRCRCIKVLEQALRPEAKSEVVTQSFIPEGGFRQETEYLFVVQNQESYAQYLVIKFKTSAWRNNLLIADFADCRMQFHQL